MHCVNVQRFKALIAEYAGVAFATYFAIFALVLAGFALAISAGVQVETAQGGIGVLGAAYLATKLTQPLRIGATVLLTPIVARVVDRIKARRPAAPVEDAEARSEAK